MTTDNEALKLAEKCGAEILDVHFLCDIKNGMIKFTRTELEYFYNAAIQTGRDQMQRELAKMEQRKDAAYLERNQVVAALCKCFPASRTKTSIEGWSNDWHSCVYINLPTGQVSWHYHDSHAYLFEFLPERQTVWDGHTTEEKYARLAALIPQPTMPKKGE